jgi:HEAT repeat protein
MSSPGVTSSAAGRLAALEALPEGPGREQAILAALEDEAPTVRDRAIRLATRYIEPEVLGELLADEANATRRNAAIVALERQGPYAVRYLESMLVRLEVDVVMFALQTLARIGDPSVVRSVMPLARHPEPNVAQSAIEALGQLRSAEAVPVLLEMLRRDLWLQLAAIDALGEIGSPAAVAPLIALVPDSIVAEPAVRALQRISAPESLEPMVERLLIVRERPLRDALLLAIGVVIDLHPEPVPVAIQYNGRVELDPSRDLLGYLEEIIRGEPAGGMPGGGQPSGDPRDGESLLRAAIALIAVSGLRSLFPPVLIRIATDESVGWAEGIFRRHPAALLPALRDLFRHTDPRVRRGALLAGSFEAEDLPRVLEQLEDGDVLVRAAACRALGLIGEVEGVPLLIHRLQEGEPAEQAAAVDALAEFPAESLHSLESCLGPEVPQPVLAGALEVLGKRGMARFEARIVELTRHRSPVIRRAAIRAAAQLPGAGADVVLIRALADRDQPIQVEALELLVKRDQGKTIPTLSALLGADDSFRYHVIRALGHMRAAEAAPKLEGLYGRCGPYEQVEIVQALVRIGGPGVAAFLKTRLSEPEPEIRRLAARGLATLADRAQLSLLLTLAADPDWCIRDEAARGLGLLGMAECREPLLTLARDVEPVVAMTARAGLGQLQTGASVAA